MKWINHHLPLFVVTSDPCLLNLCPPFRFVPVLLICHVSQNTVFAWLFIDVADLFPSENEIAPLNLITSQVALGNRDCSKTLAITLGLWLALSSSSSSWTFTLTETSEACSSSGVHLGSFVSSWTSRWFGWPAPPGKVHHFSLFVDNDFHYGSLESLILRNGFLTLSRLTDFNNFVSHPVPVFL